MHSPTHLAIIIIVSAFLITLGNISTLDYFGKGNRILDNGLQAIYASDGNERIDNDIDNDTLKSDSLVQDNVIFSKNFEGKPEIFQNESTPLTNESKSVNKVNGSNFKVETVLGGIKTPSNMAFIGPDDILFLEKNDGTVNRIVNGVKLENPLLDLNVVHSDGLLGIAISQNKTGPTNVFLYLTESPKKYHADINDDDEVRKVDKKLGKSRECNCLYRYELDENKLINPKLLLKLPAGPGGQHHGGEIMIGPDSNIYAMVGNIEGWMKNSTSTKAQNFENGTEPDGRAGILRITQDGKPIGNGIIGDNYPSNLYYTYGLRNGFGMDFDPVTGKLWDTENGPDHGDEINLVEPGFNSGSDDVYGMSFLDNAFDSNKLATFNGAGKYSDPEFVWNVSVGPTAIKFLNSTNYGKEFENDGFVGDINNGNLYHFDLNNARDALLLNGTLTDKVASSKEELDDVIFMNGFVGITDIQVSPDGYLYILGNNSIYKILPNKVN